MIDESRGGTEAGGQAQVPARASVTSTSSPTDIELSTERTRPARRRRQPALLAFGLVGVVVGFVLVQGVLGPFFGVVGLLLVMISIAVGLPEVIGSRQR